MRVCYRKLNSVERNDLPPDTEVTFELPNGDSIAVMIYCPQDGGNPCFAIRSHVRPGSRGAIQIEPRASNTVLVRVS
jgi:hypothetical protein